MSRSFALAVALLCSSAAADDREACLSAHADAQKLRKAGELRAARKKLLYCASGSCPDLLTADCVGWLSEVDRDMPTVVFAMRDATGHELVDVRVFVDNQKIKERIDGRPVALDPGAHLVRFEPSDGSALEQKVVLSAGEKNREVAVAQASRGRPELRIASYAVGGLGAVAISVFVGFAISGQLEFDDLQESCAPRCPTEDTDAVNDKFLAADVSLGIGLGTLGVGAALFVLSWVLDAPPRVEF